jgi:hypothetical protein
MRIVTVILVVAILVPTANGRKISEVLNESEGDFDPWNENRWSG